jgi:O-antigen ligase
MSFAIGSVLLLLVLGAMLRVPSRPSIAVGLLITLYAVEQMLMSHLPFVASNSSLYNYTVGAVGALAILISLYRFGAPRIPRSYLALVGFFFLYTCASFLWTPAPITATDWLTHFVAEVPLCVLVSICTLRSYEDFKAPIRLVVAIATLVSVTLLTNPAQEIGGRTYLVGLATVLSPAEMTGAALVLLASVDRDTLGVLARLRVPIGVTLGLALFQSGARGQFLLAITLPAVLFVSRRLVAGLTGGLATVLALTLAASMMLALVAFDSDVSRVRAPARYSAGALAEGLGQRLQFIEESLTFERPIFGRGVAGWSYMHNHADFVSKLDRSRITYPHNSLAHVYFELGLIGLIPFVALIALTVHQGLAVLRSLARDPVLQRLAGGMLLYFFFSFGLSLKQSTYLAILGFYLSGSMIAVLATSSRHWTSGSPGPSQRGPRRTPRGSVSNV